MEMFHKAVQPVSIKKLSRRYSRNGRRKKSDLVEGGETDGPESTPASIDLPPPASVYNQLQYKPAAHHPERKVVMPSQWIVKHETSLQEALSNAKHGKSSPGPSNPEEGETRDGKRNVGIQKLRESILDVVPKEFHKYQYIDRPPTRAEREKFLYTYIPDLKAWRLLVFPPMLPSGRRDVTDLSKWLSEMVKSYLSSLSSLRREENEEKFVHADQAMETLETLYRLAVREIAREDKLICFERGTLLQNLESNLTTISTNRRKILQSKYEEDINQLKLELERIRESPIKNMENILGTILELKGSLKVTEGNYKSLLSEINSSGATRLGTANAKGETPEALRIKELEEENQALKGELNMLKNQQSRIDDCINK